MDKASGPDVNAFPPMACRPQLCKEEGKSLYTVRSKTQRNESDGDEGIERTKNPRSRSSNSCDSSHDSQSQEPTKGSEIKPSGFRNSAYRMIARARFDVLFQSRCISD